MEKTVIWSLFDSETAITQKLNSDKYEVYSIGLPSSSAFTDNFIHIDLSRKSCIKKLERLPKPDIIFASPPCETWINVTIGNVRFYKRNYNEHNLYWQKNFKANNYARKHRELRLDGQKTAYWTAEIIKHFKPKMWCIENGSTSIIFKYIYNFNKLSGYKNLCYYDNYSNDNFSKKPTYIYSNMKMKLKHSNIANDNRITLNKNLRDKARKSGEWMKLGFNSPSAYLKSVLNIKETYADRSRVPLELYQHILEFYEGKHQLQLF